MGQTVSQPVTTAQIAAVAIGRNEGARLKACMASLQGKFGRIVYVDSGSTDNSIAIAEAAGAEIVRLAEDRPFTAARGRNAGMAALPEDRIRYVQLLDGDCALQPGWLPAARSFLDAHPDCAVVCGRRRERRPDASVYNRLCDEEWNTPVGQAKTSGGDALVRLDAVRAVGGFRDDLIAGEEPEMCMRLARAGWSVWRIDEEMTLHDAAMTRFSQWWRRSKRSGHAFAEGAFLHGAGPERLKVAELRRTLFWGGALPVVALAGAALVSPWALLLLLAYPAQILRMTIRDGGGRNALVSACFLTLGKLPETLGIAEFHIRRKIGQRSSLIEYK
ncbi:glycosyltransferase family 2 protein [Salipiger sp. IMCC34102]|uniref:glycosyltransferase family 2 protein n=1 Tax=Salipiger sp. IMCC34102 TaxID=2510647 RepID=UPI001F5DBC59|nr:glycosyltransferase [Salipiger sp. IMCC34102]